MENKNTNEVRKNVPYAEYKANGNPNRKFKRPNKFKGKI